MHAAAVSYDKNTKDTPAAEVPSANPKNSTPTQREYVSQYNKQLGNPVNASVTTCGNLLNEV